jgi:hypothetical protein
MDSPGDEVRQAEVELVAAHKVVARGTRKRKAGEDSTDGRREHTKRPFAQRKEQAESTKKRIYNRFIGAI